METISTLKHLNLNDDGVCRHSREIFLKYKFERIGDSMLNVTGFFEIELNDTGFRWCARLNRQTIVRIVQKCTLNKFLREQLSTDVIL